MKAVKLLIFLVLAPIIVICLLLGTSTFIFQAFHFNSYAIMSGSMAPTIPQGALAIINSGVTGESLETGDIIAFSIGQQTGHLCVHRAVAINREGGEITTKGDANESADIQPVSFDAIKGKVIGFIPYLGYVLVWANANWLYVVLMGAAAVLMLIACFLADQNSSINFKPTKGASCQILQKQHISQG